jgi:DNA-binding NarL/FixJ family response regulator
MAASERQRQWGYTHRNPRLIASKEAKLTAKQRDEIRRRLADGEDPADLALEYNVSAGTIRHYR